VRVVSALDGTVYAQGNLAQATSGDGYQYLKAE
jgi:hypothetical protein